MIQIDNLSISYHGEPLFRQASFGLQPGERCGLVGRNGSGKSTLFRLLKEQEIPDSGSIITRKDYKIGVLDQHIHFSHKTLLDEAVEALPQDQEFETYKAEKILFGLGFKEEDMTRAPSEFSGGYQLRLHLAKVLISNPDCLLLDEPTNYLDIVSIRWFERFLKRWKGEFILISHDREFMDSVTTHTLGIHRNQVRKVTGGTTVFFEQLLEEEKVHEQTRQKLEKKREHAKKFIDRFGAKATKAAQAGSRKKMLERLPVLEALKDIHNLGFEFNQASFPGKKMLRMTDVDFSYEPSNLLINDFNLSLEKGERVAFIGKNGRGKSTLLRLLGKDLTPTSGNIDFSDNLSIGYFGQTNIDRLNPKNSIEQEISRANPKLSTTDVRSICGVMMFSGALAEKPTRVLSGGEKSRVLLGKILATPCNLLLLDEPTHHLDIESIEALIDALEDFEGSLVLVTHSELMLKRLHFDKIVICKHFDQEVFEGDYNDFLEKRGWGNEVSVSKKKKSTNKREKAVLIEARAKALKPFDQKITRLETIITKSEVKQQSLYSELANLSQSGNSQKFQDLSKNSANLQNEIDTLYQDLEKISDKREAIYQDYSKKIENL